MHMFKAWKTFVHVRKRVVLTKKAQKLFCSTYLFYDTISLFSLTLQPRNWQEYSLALRTGYQL